MAAPLPKRHKPDASSTAPDVEGSSNVLVLDARQCPSEWPLRAAAAFSAAHAATGVWPAAVHVRNVVFPCALDVLTHPSLWDILADRCGAGGGLDTHVTVHDLDAARPQQAALSLPLSTWAAVRRYRAAATAAAAAAPGTAVPPAPQGVAKAQWAAILSGAHRLYLSAFEAQTHAPELAAAFNARANSACLLRHVPGAFGENLGPILMDADAGACSGWHRDGTRVRGAAFRAGDVNAFHAHLAGRKRWLLFPPRCSDAVASALQHAPANAFGNLTMTPAVADELAKAGMTPLVLESCGGDVVLLGKHVWHTVDTLEASVSLASDRLLSDQLGVLATTLRSLDGRPLIASKWAIREAAASLSVSVLHGAESPSDVTSSILSESAAFLDAQAVLEPVIACTSLFGQPACVSCDRPHAQLRYCYACGGEIFNLMYVCASEECPFEACGACGAAHRAAAVTAAGAPSGQEECPHSSLTHQYLHFMPEALIRVMQRVRQAAALPADNNGGS